MQHPASAVGPSASHQIVPSVLCPPRHLIVLVFSTLATGPLPLVAIGVLPSQFAEVLSTVELKDLYRIRTYYMG